MGLVDSIKNRLDALEKMGNAQKNIRTAGKGTRFQSDWFDTYTPPRNCMMAGGGTGWNPDIWKPVIATGLPVSDMPGQTSPYTAGALLSVDNCVVMCGRMFKDFGSLIPIDNQVLSGVVMAVFDHPLWALDTPSLRCQLSSCPSLNNVAGYSQDFTAMPLYYITHDGALSVDYRGMPTITMWS